MIGRVVKRGMWKFFLRSFLGRLGLSRGVFLSFGVIIVILVVEFLFALFFRNLVFVYYEEVWLL